jgi:hypothetical protein
MALMPAFLWHAVNARNDAAMALALCDAASAIFVEADGWIKGSAEDTYTRYLARQNGGAATTYMVLPHKTDIRGHTETQFSEWIDSSLTRTRDYFRGVTEGVQHMHYYVDHVFLGNTDFQLTVIVYYY